MIWLLGIWELGDEVSDCGASGFHPMCPYVKFPQQMLEKGQRETGARRGSKEPSGKTNTEKIKQE